MATLLLDRIKRHVEMSGPLPIAEYMHWCMADSEAGYYKTQQVLGRSGDFITAPEISQMFGELIGVWAISEWEGLGRPTSFNLVELGPGKGTLMADLLRAVKISLEFSEAANIHLVETSDKLIAQQHDALATHTVQWHVSFSDVPDGPAIIIANEFLDVLPMRQYVKAGDKWCERVVGMDEKGALAWLLGTGVLDKALLPDGSEKEPDGTVIEISTIREAFVSNLAEHIKAQDGSVLFIDYGHGETNFGDTFQAIAAHEYADPLVNPGEADLTSHVDFEPLIKIAEEAGLDVDPLQTQGEFLLGLGLLERAGQLGADKSHDVQIAITKQAERLALPHEMGELFKVLIFRNKP